jgi:hypothetical protein
MSTPEDHLADMPNLNIHNLDPSDAYDICCVFGILSNICDNNNNSLCPSTELRDIYFTIGRYYAVNKISFALMSHFLEAFSSNFTVIYYQDHRCLIDNSNETELVDIIYRKDNQWIIDTIETKTLYINNDTDNDDDDDDDDEYCEDCATKLTSETKRIQSVGCCQYNYCLTCYNNQDNDC